MKSHLLRVHSGARHFRILQRGGMKPLGSFEDCLWGETGQQRLLADHEWPQMYSGLPYWVLLRQWQSYQRLSRYDCVHLVVVLRLTEVPLCFGQAGEACQAKRS